jgi:hypothetical protein
VCVQSFKVFARCVLKAFNLYDEARRMAKSFTDAVTLELEAYALLVLELHAEGVCVRVCVLLVVRLYLCACKPPDPRHASSLPACLRPRALLGTHIGKQWGGHGKGSRKATGDFPAYAHLPRLRELAERVARDRRKDKAGRFDAVELETRGEGDEEGRAPPPPCANDVFGGARAVLDAEDEEEEDAPPAAPQHEPCKRRRVSLAAEEEGEEDEEEEEEEGGPAAMLEDREEDSLVPAASDDDDDDLREE